MARDRVSISMTFSKEVAEMLRVFKNKSKLVDNILASLLLNLSKEEVIELLINDDDVALYLIKRKCRELNGGSVVDGGRLVSGTGTEQVKEQKDKSATVSVNKKPKINPQDFWG